MQKKTPLDAGLPREEIFLFRLYITGASSNSSKAITNLKKILDRLPGKKYELEIIDVYQNPEHAKQDNIIALPMLVKLLPLPKRKLIGDMSDKQKVEMMIGLENIQ